MKNFRLSAAFMILLCGATVAITVAARFSSTQMMNNGRSVDTGLNKGLTNSGKQSVVEMKLNDTDIPEMQPNNYMSTHAQNDSSASIPSHPDDCTSAPTQLGNHTSTPTQINEGNSSVLRWQIPEPKAILEP